VTIWDAAAPLNSQFPMIVGVGVLVPVILSYAAIRTGCFAARLTCMPATIPDRAPLRRRLAWFATLYLIGVAAVGALAFILKLWIAP
jgi:hypothetical protein